MEPVARTKKELMARIARCEPTACFYVDAQSGVRVEERGVLLDDDGDSLRAGLVWELVDDDAEVRVRIRSDVSANHAANLLRKAARAIEQGALSWAEQLLEIAVADTPEADDPAARFPDPTNQPSAENVLVI